MTDLKRIKLKYVTDNKGKRTEVILKVKQFNELLEDLKNIASVAERREEEVISHKDLLKDLKKNGFI